MARYLIISVVSGILFALLDGLLNANPLAIRLSEWSRPITKTSIAFVAGILIDLAYGFILAGLFLLLYPALPGAAGILKGLVFGLIVWFLRVVMSVASHWMMYKVPCKALLYTLAAGLVEMLALGVLYGLALRPVS